MTNKGINIKRILPTFLFIAINMGIFLGAARANGLFTQTKVGREAKLTLRSASPLNSLSGGMKEGLVEVNSFKNRVVSELLSKDKGRNSLDVLAGHLLG